MINIKVNEREVKIPQSYNEIGLKDFSALWKIMQRHSPRVLAEGEELTDDEVLEEASKEYDLTIELVAHLLNLSKEETKLISYDQATEVVQAFNTMMDKEGLDELFDKKKNHFVYKGEAYYLPKAEYKETTFGEYCELQQMQQIYGKETANQFDFIHKQIALSCRMYKEEKDSYDIAEREKLFENIPMNFVLQWTFFLTRQTERLAENIQTFLEKNPKVDSTEKQNTLLRGMDGLTQYTKLLKTAYSQRAGRQMP